MRVFGPIILAQALLMTRSQPKLTAGAPVGRQPIGHDDGRSVALLPKQLAHEPDGCGSVPARLHEGVQDLALTIDGSPQPQAFAPNHDSHFVEMPPGAWLGTKPTEVARESWPELENPAPNCLVGHIEAALGQELFHVAVAQGEPEIQPNRASDDLGWELMTGIGDGLHGPILPPPSVPVTMLALLPVRHGGDALQLSDQRVEIGSARGQDRCSCWTGSTPCLSAIGAPRGCQWCF